MRIQTRYFGEVEVKEEDVLSFSQGLPGFPEENKFSLLALEENGLFQVLQSVNNIDPAFVVVDPFLFVKDYEFKLDDKTKEQLKLHNDEAELEVKVIVTMKDSIAKSTANLQAPIIINVKEKLAKQYITNTDYTPREFIFKDSSIAKEEV